MNPDTGRHAAIILDGNQRSALAAVRSLGMKGIEVVVGAEKGKALASSSRYCVDRFIYPSPDADPDAFLRSVAEKAAEYPGPVLFPMTDITMNEILLHRDLFPENTRIPFSDHALYEALSDKEVLFRQAGELSIPMPRTLFSSDFRDADALLSEAAKLGFPLVVKAAHSRERAEGKYIASSATYADDPGELKEVLGRAPFDRVRCLVQERIRGDGVGIFLLVENGEVLARFAHRRIREKPPSGGVSVLSESILPPAAALESACRLVSAVRWSGVAMVEYKWDEEDNLPKLIEVNARFWGSLNLAVRAGVDFPYLLYRMALGEKVQAPSGYRVGLKSRWELGDLDHLLIRLSRKPGHPSVSGRPVKKTDAVAAFLVDFFRPTVVHEVFNFGDPRPFLHEAKEYLRHIAKSA